MHISSYGDLILVGLRGIRLMMCAAHIIPSAHKNLGRFLASNQLLQVSVICLIFLYATPFCCGVSAQESCLLIPSCQQKEKKSLEVNSPPLSILSRLIFMPISPSTVSLNSSVKNISIQYSYIFEKFNIFWAKKSKAARIHSISY